MSQLEVAKSDSQLIMFRKQESVLRENLKEIEASLAAVHRSRTSANIALIEIQTAIRLREVELGVVWWDCECGARTTNPEGCPACLAKEAPSDAL